MSEERNAIARLRECGSGRLHELREGEVIVGRDGGADVQLAGADVSRQHARLQVGPAGVLVFDLGSKNGVRVSGVEIDGPTPLGHGDRIELGGVELELEHPGAGVARALRAGGEVTVTRTRREPRREPETRPILLPLVVAAVFGALVVVLLVLG